MITLTRRYRFPASHRLHLVSLNDTENERLYGKCNNPYGHGHDYILEVTCAGQVNLSTGLLIPVARLDQLVESTILSVFAYRNINADVPQFAKVVPTTENIVLVIEDLLRNAWKQVADTGARLCRIHVQETDRNGFEMETRVHA